MGNPMQSAEQWNVIAGLQVAVNMHGTFVPAAQGDEDVDAAIRLYRAVDRARDLRGLGRYPLTRPEAWHGRGLVIDILYYKGDFETR